MSDSANPDFQLSNQGRRKDPASYIIWMRRSYAAHPASGKPIVPVVFTAALSGCTVPRHLRQYFRIGRRSRGISHRNCSCRCRGKLSKTKRAGRVIGFDQTPDFIVPDEFNAQIVIEAKLTEDDGTARDKITRVQHLGSLSMQGRGLNEHRGLRLSPASRAEDSRFAERT